MTVTVPVSFLVGAAVLAAGTLAIGAMVARAVGITRDNASPGDYFVLGLLGFFGTFVVLAFAGIATGIGSAIIGGAP